MRPVVEGGTSQRWNVGTVHTDVQIPVAKDFPLEQSFPFQFPGALAVSAVETAEFSFVKSTNHVADHPIPNCHSSQDLVGRGHAIMAAFINEHEPSHRTSVRQRRLPR